MSAQEMAKVYDPKDVEARWQQWWEESGCFKAEDTSDKPAHMIAMPPPNVTGQLHMGHALTASLQDILTRWRRMQGYNALWLPGSDHAGIATQMVVERHLQSEGISRFDLGRERFIERVWEWKAQYHARITEQHKRMGVSCDWDRERFTMDEGLSRAVREVFVRLHEEGLIYRAERLVNWCPKMHTVLSDLEVESTEEDGHLWHMAYPVEGEDLTLVVATTRPETMLGDTAVAVHPEDDRYKHLIGKQVRLPLTGRLIPIVGDEILVDMAFGTGCVKVTPAHDFNDFETGRRHGLEIINIFDKNAHLNEAVPETYQGLERYAARDRIVADLDALGLLVKIEDHQMAIGRSQRSGAVVEPMLSKQWYANARELAKEAIRVVEEGEIKIVPEHWTKTYFHWMNNIRDWCISRQLWWGHRIPAWYCDECGEVTVTREDPSACVHCGSDRIEQDSDVLDTWFSSGLWPFSTLGWPDQTPALKTFYPNAVMETGHDILFFWVARMIMMGCKFMGGVPFKTVYLHAMVRDEHGKKMSKTTGNVIDPLTVVESHGADALRFTLAALTVAGRSIKLSEERVNGYRNFANKVWNASRFALMNLEGYEGKEPNADALSEADKWILTKLGEAQATVNASLERFDFGTAASEVYQFFWAVFCDWYIELAKVDLQGEGRAATQWTLRRVLDGALRLLHPFMPHLTEEIWQRLPREAGDPETLTLAPYAFEGPRFEAETARFDKVVEVISGIRQIRGENNLGAKPMGVVLSAGADVAAMEAGQAYITRLGRISALTIEEVATAPEGSAAVRAGDVDVIVPLQGLVDFGAERARLQKVVGKLQKEMLRSNKKLQNPKFVERAAPAAVEKERGKLAQLEAEHRTAEQALSRLPAE